VIVTVTGDELRRSLRLAASSRGRFIVAFAGVRIANCSFYTIRARGSRGSQATFRFIPECAQP
jgi:hypothetical protein